jgi:hypothetical protein
MTARTQGRDRPQGAAPHPKTMLPHPHTPSQAPTIRLTNASLRLLHTISREHPIPRSLLLRRAGYTARSAPDRPLARLWASNLITTTPEGIDLTPTGAELARALEHMLATPRPTRAQRALSTLQDTQCD